MRPYVILNSAISLDGKIATRTGESRLSSPEDMKRVHRLRATVDGIMIGVGTLLADDPNLKVKFVKGQSPIRIIVDGEARTPLTAQVVRTARLTPTIIAVTSRASARKIAELKKMGATVLVSGGGPRVSLPILMSRLREMGIRRLLLEGGGTLNWSMLSQGLVDEISVAISPKILGGSDAVTLADGRGVKKIRDAVKLRLLRTKRHGADLVAFYKVLH